MFKANSIKNRILDTLSAKLDALQKGYEDECQRIDQRAEKEKITLSNTLVNDIVSKIM